MRTFEISRRFTDFFVKKNHVLVPSASLIMPDPNLLFVNAGMVPFVPFFLGQKTPEYSRATSIQKCVRTLDIEEVGITTRHNTFFQMAGNFSFGDYFKEQAISFAWELLTSSIENGGFGIDPSKLWVTVYFDDLEALEIWNKKIGIPLDRIQKRGKKDNFWSMNIPGPSGPSSEIYFDKGSEYGKEGGPIADEDRYMEIWNLVFMEKIRGEGIGKDNFEIVGDLPRKNIDTGLGIERIASLLQGVENVYETDLLYPIIKLVEEKTSKKYKENNSDDIRFRIIADHTRTATMLIGDGVIPSNDGRGYVLRRLLRRIVRSHRLLGSDELVLDQYVALSLKIMSDIYPELIQQKEHILDVVKNEEISFAKTIDSGSRIFANEINRLKTIKNNEVSGELAFELHDTFGFPIDLTLEMAQENGLKVNRENFNRLMFEQKNRAKQDSIAKKQAHKDISIFKEYLDENPTEFLGYDQLNTEARVLAIFKDNQLKNEANIGEEVTVILDRTTLYAESGGQLSDSGIIVSENFEADVTSVQKILNRLWLHSIKIVRGKIKIDDSVHTQVDPVWRLGATKGHSGTHLIHGAIRQVVGKTAVQAGSMNKPGYLRFDFQYSGKTDEYLQNEIEKVANQVMLGNYKVNTTVTDLESAKKTGALALFGEKYTDQVRMVEIDGDFSIELCGGTHVNSSAEIGTISAFSLASIGSGVKRIEAYVGYDSQNYLRKERAILAASADLLKSNVSNLHENIANIINKVKTQEIQIKALKHKVLSGLTENILKKSKEKDGVIHFFVELDEVSQDDYKFIANKVFSKVNLPSVLLIVVKGESKINFAILVNKISLSRQIYAKDYLIFVEKHIGAKGGGSKEMVQGAGTKSHIRELETEFLN